MLKKLGQVCQFYSGTGFPVVYQGKDSGELPFYKVGDIAANVTSGKTYLSFCSNYISRKEAVELRGTIIPQNTVVFAKIGEALKLNRRAITSCDCLIDNNAMGIAPKEDILRTGYFFYYMKHLKMQDHAESTTVPSVRKSKLEHLEINIPSIDEQKTIEERLNLVCDIILKREQEIQRFDDLIKARFVEMFGDPETNCNEYPLKKLDNLVTDIIAGWSANGEARQKKDDEKAVLKVSAVTQGFFKPEEHKALPSDIEIKKYVFPHKGDLLFSRANTRELVGATAIIEHDYPDLLLPDKLWRVLFTNEINVYYAKYVLSTESIRNKFSAQSTGTSGSMFNVSSEKFRDITIPVPSRALQDDFERFVSQVDKSKVAVQNALDRSQLLFDSLMQQYFG